MIFRGKESEEDVVLGTDAQDLTNIFHVFEHVHTVYFSSS